MRILSVLFTILFISVLTAEGVPRLRSFSSNTKHIIGNTKKHLRQQDGATVDEKHVADNPADEKRAVDKSANEISADEYPADDRAANDIPIGDKPADQKPAGEMPADAELLDETQPNFSADNDVKKSAELDISKTPAQESQIEPIKPVDAAVKPADEYSGKENPLDEKLFHNYLNSENSVEQTPNHGKSFDDYSIDESQQDSDNLFKGTDAMISGDNTYEKDLSNSEILQSTETDQEGDGESLKKVGKKLSAFHAKKRMTQVKRRLQSGDVFTPVDLVPVARRLMQKVQKPGEGNGIVSGATSPYELADFMFDSYFMDGRRIKILKDQDIAGLDALQALCLSGDAAPPNSQDTTEVSILRFGGKIITDDSPKKSKYMLMYKTIALENEKNKINFRKALSAFGSRDTLLNKLQKNRHLVILPARESKKRKITGRAKPIARNRESRNHSTKAVRRNYKRSGRTKHIAKKQSHNKPSKSNMNLRNKIRKSINHPGGGSFTLSSTARPTIPSSPYKPESRCRWRYYCDKLGALDTCTLHTDCSTIQSKASPGDYIGATEAPERARKLKALREAIKFFAVDDEVNKIFEVRAYQLQVQYKDKSPVAKIESLGQYFNNVMMQDLKFEATSQDAGYGTEALHKEDDTIEIKDVTALDNAPVNQESSSTNKPESFEEENIEKEADMVPGGAPVKDTPGDIPSEEDEDDGIVELDHQT